MQNLKRLIIEKNKIPVVDLTGGAPEMNPYFRWLIERLSKLGCQVMDRCNLTIILSHPQYLNLPQFFAKHRIQIVSSLPYYQKKFTDRQRGDGVFEKSIKALRMLNEVGYGKEKSGLELDLVYNPAGAFLPGNQAGLEKDFKRELREHFQIEFNRLFAITNMPISRFLEFLEKTGNLEMYMEKLIAGFNPAALEGVMCRDTLSVGWDGKLYDCDFNQMLDIPVSLETAGDIKNFQWEALSTRAIRTDQHCYGCTAGAGSSCGGSLDQTQPGSNPVGS